jgi:GNAT superfamily N-acetyltransferase
MRAISHRPYDPTWDFLRVRGFLSEIHGLLPPGQSWDVRRWDGSNCHTMEIALSKDRASLTRIWENTDGEIVAVALHEGGHQIHPNIHPGSVQLTDEVVAWAEAAASENGDDRVFLLVWDNDTAVRRVALSRGYVETRQREVIRSAFFGGWAIGIPEVADGYTLRSVHNNSEDHQRVAVLLNAAFGRTFHTPEDHRAFVANSPSYREHTDLAVIATDGSFAAYGAVNVDEANGIGVFEPVGTHPNHRQLGLAKALMLEGMRRASDMGLVRIEVGTGDLDPPNALYDSLPFSHKYCATVWKKDL